MKGRIIMRIVATVVFVFLAGGAAAQTLRAPSNAGASSCLRLANNARAANEGIFQTDILEPAGADRLRARFLVSNRCLVAVRVMGGLRGDGSEIRQRGPIDVLAASILVENNGRPIGTTVGHASMPSFVVPANGQTEVSVLIVLDAVITPSEVPVVYAPSWWTPGRQAVYIRGGSERLVVTGADVSYDVAGWCAHYEDRRCGEY